MKLSNQQSETPFKEERTDQIEKKSTSFEIPQELFIETPKLTSSSPAPESLNQLEVANLQTLYNYLDQSLEKKGYEDALTNPDTSYMEEQIQYMTNQLGLLIARIRTYYASHLRSLDFHIETRKRSGMLELVDELLTHRATVLEEINVVDSIEEAAKRKEGISQNIILSYRRGFRNGIAAITYSIFKPK